MTKKGSYRFKSESEHVRYAVGLMVLNMHEWRRVLQPLLDTAISDIKEDGQRSDRVADALNDFGRYCQQKGDEVALTHKRRGVVKSTK